MNTILFQEEGIGLEGMRGQLLLNPVVFQSNGQVIAHLERVLPTWARPQQSNDGPLELTIQFVKRSIRSELHEYLLEVTAKNVGTSVVEPSHADIEIPTRVLEQPLDPSHVPPRTTETHTVFRNHAIGELFPEDSKRIFEIPYFMNSELFWERGGLFDLLVRVTVYGTGPKPVVAERPFKELQIF